MLLKTALRTREQDPASRLAAHEHRQTKKGQGAGEGGQRLAGWQALYDGYLFRSEREKSVG